MTRKRFLLLLLGIFGIVLCSLALFVLLLLNMWGVSYPLSESLARLYLDGVLKQDIQAVENLASDGFCRRALAEQARQDIAKFGGADVRDVHIQVDQTSGNSETLEIILLDLKYHRQGQPDLWNKAHIELKSDYSPPGFRELCVTGG